MQVERMIHEAISIGAMPMKDNTAAAKNMVSI
jgi:hypothetical protein